MNTDSEKGIPYGISPLEAIRKDKKIAALEAEIAARIRKLQNGRCCSVLLDMPHLQGFPSR